MSLSMPASAGRSVFRGIRLCLVALAATAMHFAINTGAPLAADAAPQPLAAAPATAGASVATGVPALGPQTQAAMSLPMPSMGPYTPPSFVEPVTVRACRLCREGCFRDYGGPCADATCARALPLCMRNCWYAVCR